MKKSHILFAALLAFAVLIFTSCGALTSARSETGSFTFEMNEATAENIAKNAGSGSTVTVKVTVQASDGSYKKPAQERSTTIPNNTTAALASALSGMTFTFMDVPYNKEMTLKVDVMVDNKLTASSITRKFTITKNGAETLEAALHKEFDSPYIIAFCDNDTQDDDDTQDNTRPGQVMVLPADTVFPAETSDVSDLQPAESNHLDDLSSNFACCDMNGVFWSIIFEEEESDWYTYLRTSYNGDAHRITVTCPEMTGDDWFDIDQVYFDSVKNRICLLGETWTSTGIGEGYTTYYIYFLNPDNYLDLPDTLEVTLNEMVPLDTNDSEFSFTNYIYNGYLYNLDTENPMFSKEGASVKLTKYTLENKDGHKAGEQVKTGTVHLDRINPLEGAYFEDNSICNDDYLNARNTGGENNSYDSGRFFFNDMAVYDDSVYILFHQEEFWAEPGTYQYNGYLNPKAYEFNQSYLQNGGYINRGGILVIDADTLTTKGTLGLTEVADSLQLPLIGYRNWKTQDYTSLGSTFAFFYEDSAMTKVAKGEFQLKFALPEWNSKSINFSNPIKIVAVKPKKLVVADSGTFLFIDDDRDADGNPVIKEDIEFNDGLSYIHVKKGSRLITVNLEDFSKSEVTTVFGEDAAPVYFNDPSILLEKGLFNLRYTATQNDASVYYYPEVTFTGENEYSRTGNAIDFDGVSGSDFTFQTTLNLPF